MKFVYKIDSIASFLGCVYLFLSISPFIMWILPLDSVTYFISFILLCFAGVLLFVRKRLVINSERISLVAMLFFFLCYMALPLFDHTLQWGRFFHWAGLFPIIFFPKNVMYNIFRFFRGLLIFFAAYSIIISILIFLFGPDLPHFKISGFTLPMINSGSYYRLYGLVVTAKNTMWQLGGMTIPRATGPFLEPGHFAIYIGIIVSLEKLFYQKMNIILLIAGFMTFSPAFIIIFIFIEIYNLIVYRTIRYKTYLIIMLIVVGATIFLGASFRQKIWHIAIERHIGRSLDDRMTEKTKKALNAFKNGPAIITGNGIQKVEALGTMSDFRGLLFKWGIIGIILISLSIFLIVIRCNVKHLLLFVPIVVLIIAHRSWMFEGPYMYIFLLFFTLDFEPQKSELNN